MMREVRKSRERRRSLMDSKRSTVLQYVNDHQDEEIAFYQQLIRTKSCNPPGDERTIADVCRRFVEGFGMEVSQIEPEPLRVSNICRLRGTEGKPVLLFNSHLDTFPPGNEAEWKYPPYGAEIHDGNVCGLGARNMKAGLAAAMLAAKAVKKCGIELKGDVLLTQTADEIKGGYKGIRVLVKENMVKADFGIYTEANPPLSIEIGSRGLVQLDITIRGFAMHTKYKIEKSLSGKPINAILKATKVIQAIEKMSFTNAPSHPYLPGPPVISVNQIWGGFHECMIPDQCVIRCDCRIVPGHKPESVIEDVQRVLTDLMKEDPELRAELAVHRKGRAVEIAPTEPIVAAVQRAVKEVIGHELPLGGAGSTSDMRFIVLDAGIPMLKFMFPTRESGTNEYESIEDFMNTIRVYAVLIVNLLA